MSLPSPAELATAEEQQEKALQTLERIARRVSEFVSEYETGVPAPAVMPSEGDVGRLYLAAYYARVRAHTMLSEAAEIEKHLAALAEIPLNARARAIRDGAVTT